MPTMSPNKDVQKNAQDWVRDLRFSNQVNMQTMGVDTDRVTPQLLLASSNKLLGISKGQQEGDMKDSLQFQRFYGPVEYFAERIQKDGGSVARSMLWKATNRGNLDFIGSGSLQPHVNAVFHESNLSQFVDNSTPIDGIDNSQKVTRIGEGGLSDEDSAPIEMRLVQPSYYGYVDPCRTAEKCYDEKTQIYTKKGWKFVTEMSLEDEFAVLIDGKPSWSKPISLQSFDHDGLMYCFANSYINFSVTPGHRMYVADEKAGNYSIEYIDNVFGNSKYVLCGAKKASEVDEKQKWFYLPKIPQAGTIKNIDKVDIVDFARFMGWYLSEGSFDLSHTGSGSPDYRVRITQSPELHPEYYEEIRDLVEKLPFGAHPKHYWEATSSDITLKRKQLYCYLEQFGGSLEKFIPDWIFEAPTEARWAFVDAILKGDGSGQRDLNTISKRLAEDFARLLFELGQSVRIIEQDQNYVSHVTGKPTGPIYQVTWHKRYEHKLQSRKKECSKGYHTCYYKGKVYCPTVPGGLVYVRRNNSKGFWCGNSPGITGYLTKNVLKGTDGKLYQKFINMHTGKEELVDAQTAAKSIVTTDEYLDSKDDYVYAIGGPRGLRIVKRSDVDYILPHSDDAFSASANTVPMLSGIKAMRLLMGCHHPETPVAVVDSNGYTHIVPAKRLGHMGQIYVLGCDKKGRDEIYAVRKVITRVPAKKSKFKKVILSSGRVLLTSAEHKWWIYNEKFQLKQAKDLQEGMLVPRSLFSSMPVRLTEIMGTPVTREICVFMGRLIRSLRATTYSYRVDFVKDKERGVDQSTDIVTALEQLGIKNYNLFHSRGIHAVSIKDPVFEDWVNERVGMLPQDRKIPSEILSLPEGYTSIFLDSYYKDLQTIGEDNQGDTWLLSIANPALRDSMSFMLNKIYTDTKYRDYTKKDFVHRALELVPASTSIGDVVLEKITKILDVQAPPVMIDIDCDDNVYAVANGIITHNSKYVSQAVPLQEREAPLVRNLDKATGMDMPTKMGKLLGTQWAPKSGMVKAVREDRIDMIYDDGTTGSVPIYKNFPANAKGWLTNYPKVKAGDKVSEGQLLATSNYTDDNGVLAMGRNLRMAYMSYHGGTYEDAITISQSAAKKLGYTTMYKTDMDKDKNIRTAKHLYMSWKPGKFTREQLQNLDDQGVVKVGATVNKGDPVILGIRTTEPSPGTLGKRILSDVTEIWEHANPGVVTDVVNGKNGIKVFATVSSPLREADKISGFMGDKGTCYSADTQVLTKNSWKYFKDLTDEDEVAVLGIDGTAHFQKPSARQVYDYEGQMYGFRSKLLSWLVTPDHYMWTCPRYEFEKGDRQFSRKKVEDIWGGNDMCQVSALFEDTGTKTQITLAQPIYPKSDYEGSRRLIYPIKDFAALLGIYLAQGCIGHSNVVRITQKRDLADPVSCDRCDKLEALFARMQLPWRRDGYHYDITHKALRNYLSQFGKSGDKFIPEEVFTEWPHEAQQILLEWLYLGDGEKYGKINRLRVTSAQLIDDAQRLYILNGYYAATIHNYPPRYREYKGQIRKHAPLHGVTFSSSKYKHMQQQGFEGSKYPGYYKQLYSGKVYCCTVSTGVILVQRQGRPMWCGNCAQIIPDDQMPRDSKGRPLQVLFDPLGIVSRCNPSQMMQAGLGKVAAKTGKPIVVPAFMPKGQSRLKYVKDLMKANNVPWKQDVYDPATGRTIKNVFTGVRYYLPLKHIADTKMSARGTAQYTAQQVPMGGGQQGCFPYLQGIITEQGDMSIGEICQKKLPVKVLSWDEAQKSWVYNKVTDWFIRKCEPQHMLYIIVKDSEGQQTRIFPTDNHMMYLYNGGKIEAGELQIGDLLAGVDKGGFKPLEVIAIDRGQPDSNSICDTISTVYDITVQDTHNYALTGGVRVSNSKRIGSLETAALAGHNAFNFLHDAKLIRGQANSDFWRSIRTGQIPTVPGEPLAHKKFFAHLQGSGMQIKRDNEGFTIFALSNKDVNELAGSRQLKSTDTYQQKSFRPIAGGLFGQDIFGPDGDKWAYIQLDSPLPNPVMQEPLARLLGISDTEFQQIIRGKGTQKDLHNAVDMKKKLATMDLEKQANKALAELKTSTKSQKDKALKKYVAIARMRDAGVRPQEYMLDRIPVLPPKFRPITSHGGLTMVADSNYLYSQLLNARDDLREAKDLPQEYQQEGQSNLYQKWKELVGLYDPQDVKLKAKNVKGLLKWALGSSPKFSGFMQKVLGSTVDTVGRGVIIPSTKIKLNEVGLPVQMAWNLYSPFVVRKLVQQGYSPVDAMQQVKERRPVAAEALSEAIQERPVVLNRAPSLHKLSLVGLNVKLTSGHAIKVNPSIDPPLAADHDGDTINSLVSIDLQLKNMPKIGNWQYNDNQNSHLTNSKSGCRIQEKGEDVLLPEENFYRKDSDMFKANTKMELIHTTMELKDLPRVEGTENKKSETVTEWDVAEGTYVSTIDPATGNIVYAPITKVSKHTNLKMFDVKFSISSAYDHIATVSEDHSLISYNPITMALEKSRPEDSVGRLVPMTRHNLGNSIRENGQGICTEIKFPSGTYQMSYDMGLFFGLMVGDGWVAKTSATPTMMIACCEPSLQEAIIELSKKANMPFIKESSLHSYNADEGRFSKEKMQRLTFYTKQEDKIFVQELIGHGAENKKIPAYSFLASRTHMLGVLMGLLATDGVVSHRPPTGSKKSPCKSIAYHTISPVLRDGVQELAHRLGVKTSVTPYIGTTSGNQTYMVNFCLEDMVRLYDSNKARFVVPVKYKQEAMERIVEDIHNNMKADCGKTWTSYDNVPFPRGLFCEFSWAKIESLAKDVVIRSRARGFIKRCVAKRIADALERRDWSIYKDPTYLKQEDRTHHTPEQALALVNKWIAMVRNEDIGWEVVEAVTPSTCTEGWDCTVPGPYTFSLSTGTVVQDTVNIHVPVSKKAIQDVRQKMMPERNLISLRKGSILYGPEKGYVQGLYVATRMGESKDVKTFETTADARKAYLNGQIDIDTPIVIKEK